MGSLDCTVNGGGVTIADPKLRPLQNNGGPTQTHALQPGRVPAILPALRNVTTAAAIEQIVVLSLSVNCHGVATYMSR